MAAKRLICICGANCGVMEKGSFIKGGEVICPKCVKTFQALKLIQNAKLAQGGIDKWKDLFGKNSEFDDLFKDMFK